MKEIERKFLVEGEKNIELIRTGRPERITQWYLNRDKNRVVRIRIKDDKAYITIKGRNKGITRDEFEYEIPYSDAVAMQSLAEGRIISKTRWIIEYCGHVWEVDEFHGDLKGLILAEIELESEEDVFELPPFIGREVSHDPRYFNSNLTR